MYYVHTFPARLRLCSDGETEPKKIYMKVAKLLFFYIILLFLCRTNSPTIANKLVDTYGSDRI